MAVHTTANLSCFSHRDLNSLLPTHTPCPLAQLSYYIAVMSKGPFAHTSFSDSSQQLPSIAWVPSTREAQLTAAGINNTSGNSFSIPSSKDPVRATAIALRYFVS